MSNKDLRGCISAFNAMAWPRNWQELLRYLDGLGYELVRKKTKGHK